MINDSNDNEQREDESIICY